MPGCCRQDRGEAGHPEGHGRLRAHGGQAAVASPDRSGTVRLSMWSGGCPVTTTQVVETNATTASSGPRRLEHPIGRSVCEPPPAAPPPCGLFGKARPAGATGVIVWRETRRGSVLAYCV